MKIKFTKRLKDSLDLFLHQIIDSSVIQKTYSADMPAVGGIIEIEKNLFQQKEY